MSLADKLDTLVGYFALGRIPTGSQDPFALRRQAQGIVQILLQKKYRLSLKSFIDMAAEGYTDVSLDHEHRQALVDFFFLARLRVLLLDQGYAYDILDAVLASGDDRIPHLLARVQALSEFRQSDAFGDLSTGFERIYNLAKKGVKAELVAEEFEQADQNFFTALQDLKKQTETFVENGEYQAVLESLASLRTQIDQFFAEVMIMAENPVIQNNRLALLYQALNLYLLCGDLSKIVISK